MPKPTREQIQHRIRLVQELIGDLMELDAVFASGQSVILRGRPRVPLTDFRLSAGGRLSAAGYNYEIETASEHGGPLDKALVNVRFDYAENRFPWMNLALFALTAVTTTLVAGGEFAAWFLAVLLFHEFGHFIAARIRRIDVSWPYFIPFPNMLGTLGAFIRLRSPIRNRVSLFDMAVTGPLAGFVIAVLALFVGLSLSTVVDQLDPSTGMVLGESLIFKAIASLVMPGIGGNESILLHPIAFAGWAGLLVTMLNLLPIGQLDGGHIAYALFGRKQRAVALAVIVGLGVASFWWYGWLIWVVIAMLMRPAHPPTLIDEIPLDRGRRILGWVSFAIFAITFTPIPFQIAW